ncbi:hypothetical protein [Bacillus thuringiensis]|uniref:Uncharacterized protein n=1 Tax=Bacillus thuringiensis serovar andalousiensis TaxID=257985 RepID=A0A6H0TP25_BACTU|nr:hypothetical protein EVG22_31345 [Bacillus thuringiensis serovar andalousiensis]
MQGSGQINSKKYYFDSNGVLQSS